MSVLIKDMEMPKEGFIEIIIRDEGTVQQTGQSYRIDGTDYYTPYVGEMPTMFEAVEIPCDYDELLKAARAMHTWIFLHSGDENMAYKACGLSDEMNAFLGYSGPYDVTIPADKESRS